MLHNHERPTKSASLAREHLARTSPRILAVHTVDAVVTSIDYRARLSTSLVECAFS